MWSWQEYRGKIWQLFSSVNLGIYRGISVCFLMRFLNHHYTHNSDVRTCACLKRTPGTINITNHGPCQANSPEIYWGKTSMPSFSHNGCTTVCTTGDSCEKALHFFLGRVALREIHNPKNNKSPHQDSPLPASCTQPCTENRKEWPANAEHSGCSGSPGGFGILHDWSLQQYQLVHCKASMSPSRSRIWF